MFLPAKQISVSPCKQTYLFFGIFAPVASRNLKIFIGTLFLVIFLTKVTSAFAPAFFYTHAKTALAASTDQDFKGDAKDAGDKEDGKDKLPDTVLELTGIYTYTPLFTAANFYFHQQQLLYQRSHYPAVLLPPPNRA